MKNNIVIYILLVILMTTACSSESLYTEGLSGEVEGAACKKIVTFSQVGMDGVSVLIFARKNTGFKYLRDINTGWAEDGKISTLLEVGTYKFLFFKQRGTDTSFYPNPLDVNSDFEDIEINANKDPLHSGYLLPVDEIWLAETEDMAKEMYVIDAPSTIKNKLKRAVSRIQVNVNRGYNNGTEIIGYPFSDGENVMEHIKEIKMEIIGIGESITISGGKGLSKTQYSLQTATKITTEGYAVCDGPFVFPNGTGANTSVKITIIPKDDSAFPVMTVNVDGKLERNKKMGITLWLTSIYKLINVSVNIDPISDSKEGDSGMWG